MRTSLKRWLLQRGKPRMKPLALRTSWGDFAYRMRNALDIDVRLFLGEVTLADLKRKQATKPLPRVDHGAPTQVVPKWWDYDDETERAPRVLVDRYATDPMEKLGV